MSEDKRIEEMEAELAADDYAFEVRTDMPLPVWEVTAPDGWQFVLQTKHKARIVKCAWRHYQREKRYAELEKRLAKVERELDSLRGDGK